MFPESTSRALFLVADTRLPPTMVAVAAALPALFGVFLSLAIISLGHWAWQRLRGRPDASVTTKNIPTVLKVVVGIGGAVLWVYAMGAINYRPPRYEASAIGSLRAINSAQAAFSSSCAAGGYATDLADLVKEPQGSSQGFISPDLNRNGVIKIGYVITLARDAASGVTEVSAMPCNLPTKPVVSSYFASANPEKPGETGTRYFATDTRGTIFYSLSGPIANPIPPGTSVLQ